MKLLKLKSTQRLENEIARIASEAVNRCESEVIQVVGTSVHGESIHFVRGFIRAKAGGLLRAEIVTLNTAPETQKPEFVEAALEISLESLSQTLLGELLKTNRLQRVIRLAA
jgi:hypothetical protein